MATISWINAALTLTYNQLSAFSGLDNFWQILDTAFGTQYNRSFAENLRLQWQAGDFTQLPQIEILDHSILGNANGAYASSTNKIYLSNILIANATTATINAVLLEEIGHFVDAQINLTDSNGDEGAIFAELVQGYSLDIEILEALKAEDDHTTIAVNGQIIQVEQQNFTGTNGNDTITGTSGNDVIQGLRGNDTFSGGAGNDVFVFDFERYQNNYDVVMDFVQGQDKVDIKNLNISAWATLQTLISNDGQNNALITTYYGGYASQLKLNGINSTQLQTTDFIFNTVTANDTINGDDYNGDRLFGGLGNDTLKGLRGEDILFGEQGDDLLEGGAENDILYGGAGNDTFVFDFDRYQRYQNNNDIVIDFVRGQDKVDITKLNISDWSTLQILLGNDGQNNALIKTYVDGLESKLQLNGINYAQLQSTDFIFNTVNANDVVDGNDYHGDRLFGGLGNDILRGWRGEDALFGEQGDDRLEGGADNDILYGGAGNDTAVYAGTRSQYQLSNSNGLYTITHLISNGDGIDQLYDIEKIQFSDQTITLIDTALPVINLALSPSIVSENGSANLVYTFTRTGSTTSALTVNYNVGGTATLNADYNQNGAVNFTTTAGTINFAAGASSATLSLDPIPDTIVESDETIILTLVAGTGYAIANTTPVIGTISSNTNNVGFNYSEALEKSILFYEAQRSGNLNEATNRVPWRGDSALNDGADVGVDLTGGYYDAGDHVKFGFPMASSMTMLSWGAVQYRNAYQQSGQLDEIMDAIKWGTDYILKAHVTNGGVTTGFWGQVGLGDSDHAFWGPPEKMTMARPAFKIDATKPGSDLAGEAAAALASASIIFRSTNVTYADRLLQNAIQLFAFAETYKGKYSDSITDAAKFYKSNGYNDELIWASTWLYKATKAAGNANTTYLSKAENYSTNLNLGTWTQTWDDKSYGAMVLLAQESTNIRYRTEVEKWLGFWTNKNGTGVTYTPGGLAWLNQWGSLRYAANTAFVAGVYADTVNDPNKLYSTFAESQIDYILGDNPNQRSYMVGFGNNSPQNPHHRGSHGSLTNNINDPVVNRNILYGAMVGGPDQANDNSYSDDRTNYVTNEVALDYNAGLTGAIARIYGLNGQPLNTSITLALTPTSVTEDGTGNLIYTFTRTGSTTNPLTVNYSIAGTANSSDYTGATPGTGKTITFAAGSSTATLTINPTTDTTVEANETVVLTLATGTGYTVGTTTAVTGTITNDDVAPSVTINLNANQTIVEGLISPQNVTYTVTLSSTSNQTITVQYATVNGTAIAGSDYTSKTGILTFDPGIKTQSIIIPILNNSLNEANETFTVTLTSPTNASLGTKTSATTTITDTLNASATTTLAAGVENLTLTGTANINGTGNAGNNVIRGNGGNNTLTGGGGKDTLFGGVGIDRFSYKTLTDSVLSNFDVITSFNATTGNDLFLVTNPRTGFTNAGTVTTLDAAGISAKLTTSNFGANFAAQFSFGTRTFVAINNATAGFSAAADAIIEVTGLTGTLGINNFVTV
ncbi:glycoside hydrolase family 9 protein [Anabaena azotica]|uniref:glycoside hydrolase family 9 protein n=1 Tax=Anabaena azotica TaxID=197653 RepID=UPI0039A6A7B4